MINCAFVGRTKIRLRPALHICDLPPPSEALTSIRSTVGYVALLSENPISVMERLESLEV